jgi:RNA polymerase sigma factor (TIGR02999 family)
VAESIQNLLERVQAGDAAAVEELGLSLYDELHRIATRHLRAERRNHTLQPTALIHEAYVKLSHGAERGYSDKAHFLALASRAMRQVLVDYARSRASQKRAPGAGNAAPDSLEVASPEGVEIVDLILLDTALGELAREDANLSRLIEMKYFGGMTAEEVAEALNQSVHVVRHDLRLAQAWLRRRMAG